MMQQINLYLPEFRPKRELFNARNSVVLVLLTYAIFFIQYSTTQAELKTFNDSLIAIETQNVELNKSLVHLKKTPAGESRNRIEKRIARTRAAIQNRNQISDIMKNQSLGNEQGFSSYMKALSTFALSGLFLEAFTITHGGKFAYLKGISKKPELVPLYISKLQKDSIFSETKFGHLNIKNKGKYVEFSLSGADE